MFRLLAWFGVVTDLSTMVYLAHSSRCAKDLAAENYLIRHGFVPYGRRQLRCNVGTRSAGSRPVLRLRVA